MQIIRSNLFNKFPKLLFGFSTKNGGISPEPYCLNLSRNVGDNPGNVERNRKLFFDELGIKKEQITFQKQIHSVTIKYSPEPQLFEDCDAIYTDKKNNFLAVGVADCVPVFVYSPEKKIIAAIHSGWKGTQGRIVEKTIEKILSEFAIDISKLTAYIGPSISGENYEVGEDVAKFFDNDVKIKRGMKYLLDLKKENYKQLFNCGLKKENIEVSELCTFREKDLLHSYRRDGKKSGRMFGVIGMK